MHSLDRQQAAYIENDFLIPTSHLLQRNSAAGRSLFLPPGTELLQIGTQIIHMDLVGSRGNHAGQTVLEKLAVGPDQIRSAEAGLQAAQGYPPGGHEGQGMKRQPDGLMGKHPLEHRNKRWPVIHLQHIEGGPAKSGGHSRQVRAFPAVRAAVRHLSDFLPARQTFYPAAVNHTIPIGGKCMSQFAYGMFNGAASGGRHHKGSGCYKDKFGPTHGSIPPRYVEQSPKKRQHASKLIPGPFWGAPV
ncbi:hypothetical protein D3C75_773860 [compost metagenome]